MNFLEPWGLLGMAALAPIVALYFLKLKREERVVPSTLLWKKVIEDLHVNAPFQRLRYSLLLLLQLLLVALLGFALARPFLALGDAPGRRIILLVDTSASMGTRDAGPNGSLTRLEQAVRDAKAKVDDLGRNGEMRIVAFDTEVRQRTRFTSDRHYLKEELDRLAPRHLATHAQEAFETALALAEERENTEVLVLTDGCFDKLSLERLLGQDWKLAERDRKKGNIEDAEKVTGAAALTKLRKFRFVPYGKDESDNVGITGISARTRMVKTAGEDGKKADRLETQIFVMVENFSPRDADVILSIATETQRFAPKVVKLKARARLEVSLHEAPASGHTLEASRSQEVFKLPLNTTGVVTANIGSARDAFSLDDQAQVVVGLVEGTNVLWVGEGNYFIKKAFVSMRGTTVTQIAPSEFEKDWTARGALAVEPYDAVVFENYAPPSWTDGGAIFIGKLPPLPEFKLQENPKLEWPQILEWDRAHPVMRYVEIRNVTIKEALAWETPKACQVLAEGTGGNLIVAHETDRVRAICVAFEVLNSDWALKPSLPLFLNNAIPWVAEASSRRRPTALKTGEQLALPALPEAPTVRLTRPGGEVEEVKLSAQIKTFVKNIETVGLYRVNGLPGEEGERVYAVNLASPNESDNAARVRLKVDQEEIAASPAAISSKSEIWRWLALAGIVLLLAEWWVYHRRVGL